MRHQHRGRSLCATYAGVEGVITSDDSLTTARKLLPPGVAANPDRVVLLCDRARVLGSAGDDADLINAQLSRGQKLCRHGARRGVSQGASSLSAVASWLPSVRSNGHRGPPSVQPQATHHVQLVRQRLGPLVRPPRVRHRLLPALQARLALHGRALGVAAPPHAALRALLSRRRWLGAGFVSR